jgi:hypothetical protein
LLLGQERVDIQDIHSHAKARARCSLAREARYQLQVMRPYNTASYGRGH